MLIVMLIISLCANHNVWKSTSLDIINIERLLSLDLRV